ncbi:MAG: protease modulator HflC [Rhodobacteraceae bacterium]|nr:protease modulator HflC [Paracoccaceae bacterium]
MKKLPVIATVVAIVSVFLVLSSAFVVDARQKALLLKFGEVVDTIEDPGLHWKIPFIQEVVLYDGRILSLDIRPLEVTPADDRRLVVDAFARYRISDLRKFRQAVGTGGTALAEDRLGSILNAQLRAVLGEVDSGAILSDDRAALMAKIRDGAIAQSRNLGLEVIDVRIKRADLPEANLVSTFNRMQAERQREAADQRARGEEAAQRVRANADRQSLELVSSAQRDADIIRGEADAESNRIYAEAYGRDPEFFNFYRSLSAYEKALQGSNSTMVLSPSSPFFSYFIDPMGAASGQ